MTAVLVSAPFWPSAHRDLAPPGRHGAVQVRWDHGTLHVRAADEDARAHVDAVAASVGVAFTWR